MSALGSPAPVHVAGRGAVTALGAGADALLDGVFSGRSGLRPRGSGRFAATPCASEVLGEVAPDALAGDPDQPWVLRLALAAAREALANAADDTNGAAMTGAAARAGLGLVLATTKGDLSGISGPGAGLGNPFRLGERLAGALGCGGPRAALSCACSSGLSALALAASWLRAGRVERVLVVGVDALDPFVLGGFSALLALDPGACRPFDRARRGLSLGEGAGALLLTRRAEESLGFELAGWGESNDANHVTGPSRDGGGLALAATRALARAGEDPAAVDYVHLHGTGTRYNDGSEAKGLARVFGGPTPPASGTKAQTGHTLGAAGLLEAIVALEALARRAAPANVGLEESDVDPALRLTAGPGGPTPLARARLALKVSAGFGGVNAAVVLRASPNAPTPTAAQRSGAGAAPSPDGEVAP